jgi:hypothetical protein
MGRLVLTIRTITTMTKIPPTAMMDINAHSGTGVGMIIGSTVSVGVGWGVGGGGVVGSAMVVKTPTAHSLWELPLMALTLQ